MFRSQDFDKLKSQVAAAASSAADVVQSLNELDAMADQDEYLKTDDLNVKRGSKKKKATVEEEWVEDMVNEDTSAVNQTSLQPAAASAETPTLDSISGDGQSDSLSARSASVSAAVAAARSSSSATVADTPEERAQQLIAQALFQTPMSSMAVSRGASSVGGGAAGDASSRSSPLHSSSFLDYDSAMEEEDDNDEGGGNDLSRSSRRVINGTTSTHDGNTPSAATPTVDTAENDDTHRENAVMDYLSQNSAGEGFSLLDKVMASPAVQTTKKPSATLADLDSALGNDLSTSATTAADSKPTKTNASYMLSAVAALMDGSGTTGTTGEARVLSSRKAENDNVGSLAADPSPDAALRRASTSMSQRTPGGAATVTEAGTAKTKTIPGLEYDSDSSSGESDWGSGARETDPILGLLEKERQQHGQPSGGREAMISNVQPRDDVSAVHNSAGGGSLYDGQHGVNKKDPNRFFSDIDRRTAYDVERGGGGSSVPKELVDGTPSKDPRQESFGEAPSKFAWFTQVATGRIIQGVTKLEEALSPAARNSKAGVASRKQLESNASSKIGGTTEDGYSTAVSSSLLAAEEHAELERLKQNAAANQNVVEKVIDLVQRNPRFAFIALTLLLLYFVSHWSRKRTEDDVTRVR